MNIKSLVMVLFTVVFIAGCETIMPQEIPNDPAYAPVAVPSPPARPLNPGGIFLTDVGVNLYDDRRAYRVGDIITVVLNERTVSSKSAETAIDKNADVSMGDDTILGRTVDYKGHTLLTEVDQQRAFDSSSEADQENSLQGSIAVTVADVMPNGLLVIRGEKWMTLTHGQEFIRLSGLVRPDDVSANNSISSTKVADARISYSGTGDLADANRPGWMTRFFNSPVWPF